MSLYPPLKTFADFFCGVGGFHSAASSLGLKCVFASDIDAAARETYELNYGISPKEDISDISADSVPDHDVFLAGFPCQPFSIIGSREGFDDKKNGTLFFEAARIIREKRPRAVVLENVRQLATANQGEVLKEIITTLEDIGYQVTWRILNALNFGLPQKRERIIIVATSYNEVDFVWSDSIIPPCPLTSILEENPPEHHFASERIRRSRREKHTASVQPAIWHENKGGNISSHPFSCALRANASYNYLLVDGERRLTPREMFRLQGFPDSFVFSSKDSQARKHAGNAVPVPMVKSVLKGVVDVYRRTSVARQRKVA